jgi:uncharacterized protein YkwD
MAATLGVVLALALTAVPSTPARVIDAEPVGKYRFSQREKCFLRKINDMRARSGRSRLSWDKQLGYVARRHSRGMASNGTIYHDGDLGSTVTRWKRLGQNVGTGGGCKSLFKAFKRSSGHRANILGSWRFMGVGSTKRNGRIYVMHIFQSRRNPGNVYKYP